MTQVQSVSQVVSLFSFPKKKIHSERAITACRTALRTRLTENIGLKQSSGGGAQPGMPNSAEQLLNTEHLRLCRNWDKALHIGAHATMYFIPRSLHLFSSGRQDRVRKLASKTHVDMVDHGIVGVPGPSQPTSQPFNSQFTRPLKLRRKSYNQYSQNQVCCI
jgi:hypothetical protein